MKKFLLFFAGLLLAFVIINFLYLLILPKVDWDFSKTKEAHNFNNQQLKVLVFGNSTAMDGVNTEMISNSIGPAYNFSVGGASLETNFLQFEKYLQNNQEPAMVLLFLSSSHVNYFNKFELNPIIEYYYADSLHIDGLNDIPLFRFRWSFVENFKKFISPRHRSATVIKGQLRINSMVPDNSLRNVNSPDSCNHNYNDKGYQYMWKMAALCKEKGILFKVFEMPCWKAYQNGCPDKKLTNKGDIFQDDISLYNINNLSICDTLLDPKTAWLSKNHLNYNGSIKVTGEIIRRLLISTLPVKSNTQ